jgi:hypothetical protein
MVTGTSALLGTLVAVLMLVGCAGHARPSTPHLSTVPPSKLERQWLGRWDLAPASRHAKTPNRLDQAISRSARHGGVQLVTVSTYRTPSLSPAITLAVSEPASFLKHRLKPIVLATRPYSAAYIRILDPSGRRVLEWYKTGSGGALYAHPGLEGCSPIMAYGWTNIPSCPLH